MLFGNKFKPELDLRQPEFTFSVCKPFIKHHERVQKFKGIGDLYYIYKNKLDKASFHHDAAYADSKYLAKRTVSDKMLRNRAYEIAPNLNMVDIKED